MEDKYPGAETHHGEPYKITGGDVVETIKPQVEYVEQETYLCSSPSVDRIIEKENPKCELSFLKDFVGTKEIKLVCL